jgi:hypothetical protein
MSEWPEWDWAHDPDNDPDETFGENIHKEVGDLAYRLLDVLSQDVTRLEADVHGWTEADKKGVDLAWETDWLARLVVPPKPVSDIARTDFVMLMGSFRMALPWTEAERRWLLDGYDFPNSALDTYDMRGDDGWREFANQSEAEVMSAGIRRIIRGRDLLQHWWSWRRETGEYEGQGSLEQARESLGGVIALLSPELGLPESYVNLRQARGDEPFSP